MAGIWLPNRPQVDWIEFYDGAGAATSDLNFGQVHQLETNARTILALVYPEGSGEGTSGAIVGQVPSGGSTNGPRFTVEHNSGTPGLQLRYGSTGTSNFPARNSANGTVTYNAWNLVAGVHDGSLNGAAGMRMFNGINGQPIAEVSYGGAANGSGTLLNGAGNNFHIGNREDTDRTFNGSIAYVAQWNRALDLQDLKRAQEQGPLAVPGIALLWANGRDYGPHGLRPRLITAIETRARPLFFAPLGLDIGRVLPIAEAGGADVTVALTGVAATGSVGTSGVSHTNALTGASGTGAAGTAGVDHAQSLTGAAGTGELGTLAPSTMVAITGAGATGGVGSVVASGGDTSDVTLAITGVQATGEVGTLGPESTVGIVGSYMVGDAGSLTASGGDAPVVPAGGARPTGGWGDDSDLPDWWFLQRAPKRAAKAVETAAKQRTDEAADALLRKKLARADVEYTREYGKALAAMRAREIERFDALKALADEAQRQRVGAEQAPLPAGEISPAVRAELERAWAEQEALEAQQLEADNANAAAIQVLHLLEQDRQQQIAAAVVLLQNTLKTLQ